MEQTIIRHSQQETDGEGDCHFSLANNGLTEQFIRVLSLQVTQYNITSCQSFETEILIHLI